MARDYGLFTRLASKKTIEIMAYDHSSIINVKTCDVVPAEERKVDGQQDKPTNRTSVSHPQIIYFRLRCLNPLKTSAASASFSVIVQLSK